MRAVAANFNSPQARPEEGSINDGAAPIVMMWATPKRDVPASSAGIRASASRGPYDGYLNYPNIPGEDLLENEPVIVQRLNIQPGEWEVVHIHIKGGYWADRTNTQLVRTYPPGPDGAVDWQPTFDISEGHQSGQRRQRADRHHLGQHEKLMSTTNGTTGPVYD